MAGKHQNAAPPRRALSSDERKRFAYYAILSGAWHRSGRRGDTRRPKPPRDHAGLVGASATTAAVATATTAAVTPAHQRVGFARGGPGVDLRDRRRLRRLRFRCRGE